MDRSVVSRDLPPTRDIPHPGRSDASPKRKRGSEHLPSLALRASEPRGGCAISDRVRYTWHDRCYGQLATRVDPTLARKPLEPAKLDQLEYSYRVGFFVQIVRKVLHIFAHLSTCLHKPTPFPHMPAQAGTCQDIPARPWNRLLRSASHCVKDTYIAGYVPPSLFRAGVRLAWANVAKRLESNDFRTGASLLRRPAVREEFSVFSVQWGEWNGSRERGANCRATTVSRSFN